MEQPSYIDTVVASAFPFAGKVPQLSALSVDTDGEVEQSVALSESDDLQRSLSEEVTYIPVSKGEEENLNKTLSTQALSVIAITYCTDGILYALRTKGLYEFPPAGGVGKREIPSDCDKELTRDFPDDIDIVSYAMLKELREEVGDFDMRSYGLHGAFKWSSGANRHITVVGSVHLDASFAHVQEAREQATKYVENSSVKLPPDQRALLAQRGLPVDLWEHESQHCLPLNFRLRKTDLHTFGGLTGVQIHVGNEYRNFTVPAAIGFYLHTQLGS